MKFYYICTLNNPSTIGQDQKMGSNFFLMNKYFDKGNQLFPDYQMIKRENPSKREFEESFSSEIQAFDEIIVKGFGMMKMEAISRPPHYRNRNWTSNSVNSNIQGLLIDKFGASVKQKNGRYFLKINDKIFFFKKLDEKTKRPAHNETATSKRLVNQYALPLEEPNPIIWVGYCTDNSDMNLTGIYAISLDGDNLNWIVDLTDFCNNTNSSSTIDDFNFEPDQSIQVALKQNIKKAE